MTLSSYFSLNVFVKYTFDFTPSYQIPAGSKIIIDLPSSIAAVAPATGTLDYTVLGTSNPREEC